MADSIMSKAATMEIPINSNGDTGTLPEDDSLEQVSQSVSHLLFHSFQTCCDHFEVPCPPVFPPLFTHDNTDGCLGQVLPNHAQACSSVQ